MKVVYMGTTDFAVGPLESIINAGHEVVLVVTQPDRVRGRSGKVSYSPVKEVALAHNIPVFHKKQRPFQNLNHKIFCYSHSRYKVLLYYNFV